MITARTLILGSAAGLIAMSGAQAADLPVKAKAVEYVRICSLYGAGFFYIPGTDTCIKIGGYLRADVTFNGGAHGAPAWSGDLGQQNRYRRLLPRPLPYGVDGRYPYRDRIRRGSHLRPGRLPVQQFRQLQSGHANCVPGRQEERAVGAVAAMSRLNISSSSSPASPSVSPLRLTRRPGTVSRATSIRACSAATTPTPASTTSSTPPSSATAYRPRSVSMTRPSGIAPPSTIWAFRRRSAPTAPDPTPTPARILRTSSAGSGSIRPGVCSSCRPRPMRSAGPTTRWLPAASRLRFPKSAATPRPSGAVQ